MLQSCSCKLQHLQFLTTGLNVVVLKSVSRKKKAHQEKHYKWSSNIPLKSLVGSKPIIRGNQTIPTCIHHWRILLYDLEKILALAIRVKTYPIPHIIVNTQMHRMVLLHQLQNHSSPFTPFLSKRSESHCIFLTIHTIGTKLSIPEKIIKNVQSQTIRVLKGVVHGFHMHIGKPLHQFLHLVRIRVLRHRCSVNPPRFRGIAAV